MVFQRAHWPTVGKVHALRRQASSTSANVQMVLQIFSTGLTSRVSVNVWKFIPDSLSHTCETFTISWENLHSRLSSDVWTTGVLGADCTSLGLGLGNRSSSASPNLSDSSGAVNNGEINFESNLYLLHEIVDLLVFSFISLDHNKISVICCLWHSHPWAVFYNEIYCCTSYQLLMFDL